MKLVEVERTDGMKEYVNPMHVIAVMPCEHDLRTSFIMLTGRYKDGIKPKITHVRGYAKEVAERVNQGMQ
jgi:hypothetical protein